MRKLTLLISVLALGSFVFAQQKSNAVERLSKLNDLPQKNVQIQKSVKEDGETIFEETFDSTFWHTAIDENLVAIPANMPNGWTVQDNTSNNFFWRWSLTGPRGRYTSPANGPDALVVPNNNHKVRSTSDNSGGDKGFMLLEADFYNTDANGNMVNPSISMDTYLQTRAIDCSANTGVTLYFEQWHRFCCASYNNDNGPKVLVSADGNNWTKYDVHQANVNQTPKVNPSKVEFPITSVAANQPTVYIRFHLMGEAHYHWSIDDVKLYEPYTYDLRVQNYWVDYSETQFAYYTNPNIEKLYSAIPYFSAYHAFQPIVSSRALITNYGKSAMNNVKITTTVKNSNDEAIYTVTSAPLASIAPGATDSIKVEETYQLPRTMENVGAYSANGLVFADETDQFPDNNTYVYNFNVTENLFGFANPTYANTDRQSPFSYVGSIDGDGIGVVFKLNAPTTTIPETDIPAPYTLKGVNTHINNDGYNWDIWEAGNVAYLEARVYKSVKQQNGEWDFPAAQMGDLLVISSGQVAVDSNFVNTYLYLPFPQAGTNELLTPEEDGQLFLVTIHMTTNNLRFFVGADKFIHSSYYGNWVMVGGDNDWGWVSQTANIAMELILDGYNQNITGGIHFEIMNENPVTNVTTGALGAVLTLYTADPNDPEAMIANVYDVDLTGIVEVTDLRSGSYSYTVTYQGETKLGRVGVTGSQMATANVKFNYNNIQTNNLMSDVKMYPNPANDMLTLTNLNNVRRIQITNIVGQIMDVVNNPAETQTINVANYAAGVYMVTMFDNNGNTTTHRLVKR